MPMTLRTLLAIIIGFIIFGALIFGLITFIRSKISPVINPNPTSSPSSVLELSLPGASSSPLQTGENTNTSSNTNGLKSYNSGGQSFIFPNSWGVLVCNNSQNFELDPANAESNRVNCDYAIKPITVMVNNTNTCPGETVRLGNVDVQRSKVEDNISTDYRWCFRLGNTFFDVTHRVAPGGGQATSTTDYSKEVEEMISRFGGGAS